MKKKILCGIMVTMMVASITGCSSTNNTSTSANTTVAQTTTVTQTTTSAPTTTTTYAPTTTTVKETEAIDGMTQYSPGKYKVGTDMPAGEYMIVATGSSGGYFCVSSDANGNDIIANDNFGINSIMTVEDGEFLELSRCAAVPTDEFYTAYTVKSDKEGVMLTVGKDIPAGEYKVTATSSNKGYYCIYSTSRQDDIVANDNFENSTYVNIADGQYLVLNRCIIEQ